MPFDLSSAQSLQAAPQQGGFDLSSAKPIEASGGFDLSSAKPVDTPGFLANTVGTLGYAAGQLGGGAVQAASVLGGGLLHTLGAHDLGDQAFKIAQEEAESAPGSIKAGVNETLAKQGLTPSDTGKKVGGFAANIAPLAAGPAAGPILATMQMGGQSVERAKQLVDRGVDPSTARNLALAEYGAGAAGGVVIPGQSSMTGAAIGNAIQGAATRAGGSAYLESKGYGDQAKDEPAWNDLESLATDFAFGAASSKIQHWVENRNKLDTTDSNKGEDPNKLLEAGNQYEHQTPDVEEGDLLGSHIRNPYDVGGHVSDPEHTLGDQGTLFGTSEGVDTRKPIDNFIPYEPADKTPNLGTEDKNNPYENFIPYEHTGLEGKNTFSHNEGLQPENKPVVGEHPGNDIPDISNSGPKYDNGIDFEKRNPGDQESLPLDNPIEDRPGGKQGELFGADELSALDGGRPRAGESPITGVHESISSRQENSISLDKHITPMVQ